MSKPIITLDEQLSEQSARLLKNATDEQVRLALSQMSKQDKEMVEIDLKKAVLAGDGPRNSKELWNACYTLFGVRFPYTVTKEGFDPPFKWFSDVYFGRVEQSLVLAGRGAGKTMGLSMLAYLWGSFVPKWETRHAGAVQEQAKVASKYLTDWAGDPVLGSVFAGKPGKFSATWRNTRSNWSIVTGSVSGVSSQHPNAFTADEIEFWSVEALMQTFMVPVERDGGRRKIWAVGSTRQKMAGAMAWLVDAAEAKGIKKYAWTLFDTMQPCSNGCEAIDCHPYGTDTERMQVCNLWTDCGGERARKATGWTTLHHLRQAKANLGGDGANPWRTQGLCDKPSTSGLVLHNFDHEFKPHGNYVAWTYQSDLPYYVVHDPSEGKKSVLYFFQWFNGAMYFFDELIQPSCPDVTTTKQAFYEKCQTEGYGRPKTIIVDPRRTDAVATWRAGDYNGEGMGRSYFAEPAPIEAASGGQAISLTTELLRGFIKDGNGTVRMYLNPLRMPGAVRGIIEHSYPTNNINGEVTSDTPLPAYKDEVDTFRYAAVFAEIKLKKGDGGIYLAG